MSTMTADFPLDMKPNLLHVWTYVARYIRFADFFSIAPVVITSATRGRPPHNEHKYGFVNRTVL